MDAPTGQEIVQQADNEWPLQQLWIDAQVMGQRAIERYRRETAKDQLHASRWAGMTTRARPTAKPNTRMQPRPLSVLKQRCLQDGENQENQLSRGQGLAEESIHELLGDVLHL